VFNSNDTAVDYLSRTDSSNPLASYATHAFELDGALWPSVEHYYQAMKFENSPLYDDIRCAVDPAAAAKLASKNKKLIRKDWNKIKRTIMTRGLYIMFRNHPDAATQLLASGKNRLVEKSQYDYYWGCGRDLRGDNTYGVILMEIREKLNKE